jgi:predicted MFS family arabinose efflux permease
LFSIPLSELLDRFGTGPTLRVVASMRIASLLPLIVSGFLHRNAAIICTILGALIYGLFDCMASTAERTLPALVIDSKLHDDAFSLLSAVNGVAAFVIGPSLGAVLLTTDRWLPFVFASVMLAASYIAYVSFFTDPQAGRRDGAAEEDQSFFASAFAGVRHMYRDRFLRSVVITLLGVVIAEELVVVTLTPYFEHGSGIANWPVALGVLRSVAGGVAIAGALFASSLARRFGRWRVLCVIALCGSLGPAIMAISAHWAVVLLALMISSLAESIWVPLVQSETAMRTPPQMMARTRAGMMFVTWGSLPVVSVAGGGIAQAIGIRPVLIFGSAVALISCVLGVWRGLGSRKDAQEQDNSGSDAFSSDTRVSEGAQSEDAK